MSSTDEPTTEPVEPTEEQAPADEPGYMDLDEIMSYWAQARLGHDAIMMGFVPKHKQYAFDAAEFARTGEWPKHESSESEDDDMGVNTNIGNRIVHNYYGTQDQAPPDVTPPPLPPSQPAKQPNSMAKLVIPVALSVGSALVGGGIFGTILSQYLSASRVVEKGADFGARVMPGIPNE